MASKSSSVAALLLVFVVANEMFWLAYAGATEITLS